MEEKNNQDAFDFFMSAKPDEIKNLGWRIGEKLDTYFTDDFIDEIIEPFVQGINEGCMDKFEIEFQLKIKK